MDRSSKNPPAGSTAFAWDPASASLLQALLGLLAVVAIGGVAWEASEYLVAIGQATDSGIFASIGFQLQSGASLYIDAWDHKPPLVFQWNRLANLDLADPDPLGTLNTLVRGHLVVTSMVFTAVAIRFAGSLACGLGAGLVFVHALSFPPLLEGGNLTEAYGALFQVLGIAAACEALRSSRDPWWAAAGAAFAVAALWKEVFALSALPWIALALRQGGVRAAGAFFAGGFTVGSTAALILAASASLWAYVDALSFNFAYVTDSDDPVVAGAPLATRARALFGTLATASQAWMLSVALAPLCLLSTRLRGACARDGGPAAWCVAALVAQLCCDAAGALLSPRPYGHYALTLVAPGVLLAIVPWRATAKLGAIGALAASALLVVSVAGDRDAWSGFAQRLRSNYAPVPIDPRARWIREATADDETIWSPHAPHMYFHARRRSASRHLVSFETHYRRSLLSTREEKLAALLDELRSQPPAIIVPLRPPMQLAYLAEVQGWIDAHYDLVKVTPWNLPLWRLREAPRQDEAANGGHFGDVP